MALFTGKGDGGTTKLFDSKPGVRMSKSSPLFECLGQLDELYTLTGWCKVAAPRGFLVENRQCREILHDVQNHLFTIQAEVAGAPKSVPQESVEKLSELINTIEKELPEIKTFFVTGGTPDIPAEKQSVAEFSARLDVAAGASPPPAAPVPMLPASGGA